ncbi:Rieske (2Fe-2S) protein [Streptomyces sp. CC208A]|uniref:Rieske (2Fe-2S) protein n=1 Tax=Streptomyces sp. CC208A TaxID=3044573 RepID=UPI0024A8D54F|nr:Rieske (2Fe-2S) protein [Streptomyces sp. CC208A]
MKTFPHALRSALPSAEEGPGRVLRAMDRLEKSPRADGLADALRGTVRRLPLGAARDGLHGRWLGHPVHPLLVQFPLGAWLSAAVLDLVPGGQRAARLLVGAGLAGAGPTALAGWVDWAEMRRPQLRVGLVHAAANNVGVICYAVSLTARCRGHHRRGRLWGFGGLAAVSVGGALGGHLAYRQAAGTNHAEQVPALTPPGWHPVAALADLPPGRPHRGHVGETAVVLVRTDDDTVRALAERCSHMAGPLADGEVVDGCLVCPWHGSTFRLDDGWNVTGPATAPQPAFDTRIVDGRVEVRLRA